MSKIRMAFTGWGALSILRGDKCVTRRLVTRANSLVDGKTPSSELWATLDWSSARVAEWSSSSMRCEPTYLVPVIGPRPHGKIDHKYVYPRHCAGDVLVMCEGLKVMHVPSMSWTDDGEQVISACTCYTADECFATDGNNLVPNWRWKRDTLSPRYMPTDLSRATLPLLSVTPSIVQTDMDDAEAMREGVTPDEMTTPLEAFVKVWREIHGKGSWEQRTPTWRYEWEPMEGTK